MHQADPEHILFLTGKLAQKQLQAILTDMQPAAFTYRIHNIGVSVAALMTASMIGRRLSNADEVVNGVDRIVVPGLCRGDLTVVAEALGCPCVRGPIDLKDLPAFFGHDSKPIDLSHYDVEIFAEIVDAPLVDIATILNRAEQYRRDGADVIDVGCLPDTPFPHLEEAISALKETGFKVSIDSLAQDDLLRGARAGADYLLSLKESTLFIAEEVDATPILIAEQHGDLPSLYRAIETFAKTGRPFYADPILDPIHFGFTESLMRYQQVRQQYPAIKIMMGVGNLTELTEADTTGINAILFGLISEMRLNAVLTTEVSPHCRSAVREADKARRMMFAARTNNSVPKGLDASLLGLHARQQPFPYDIAEIKAFYEAVRDPSYRIQISQAGIHVYNRDGFYTDHNPFALFPKLDSLQEDSPHAFYMGFELAKAQIAWQLGKRYHQDRALDWGICALPDVAQAANQDLHEPDSGKTTAKTAGQCAPEHSTLQASRARRKQRKKQ